MIRSAQVAVGTTQVTLLDAGGDGGNVLVHNAGAADIFLGGANNEIQNVTLTGGPAGGTFTLTYSGQTTSPGIPYNATPAQVQAALVALSNIADGDVRVTGSDLPSGIATVEFMGVNAGKDVAEMTGSGASLTGGSSPGVSIATIRGGGVTATSGFKVANGATSPEFHVAGGDRLVAITSAATATAHVLILEN